MGLLGVAILHWVFFFLLVSTTSSSRTVADAPAPESDYARSVQPETLDHIMLPALTACIVVL
jgi:hypothetical protein